MGMLNYIPSEGVALQHLWDLTVRVPCIFPFLPSLKEQLEEHPKGHDLWLALPVAGIFLEHPISVSFMEQH